jgi:hypothetical protein
MNVIQRTYDLMPPEPDRCPKCGGDLEVGSGMVGEVVLYCPSKSCTSGIVWEDSADAVRRVL